MKFVCLGNGINIWIRAIAPILLNHKSCFPILLFVIMVNNFTRSCGYCFSIIEFLEDFICVKTFQEHDMKKSIIIKQRSELKRSNKKCWNLPMNYTLLCHTLPLPSAKNSEHFFCPQISPFMIIILPIHFINYICLIG